MNDEKLAYGLTTFLLNLHRIRGCLLFLIILTSLLSKVTKQSRQHDSWLSSCLCFKKMAMLMPIPTNTNTKCTHTYNLLKKRVVVECSTRIHLGILAQLLWIIELSYSLNRKLSPTKIDMHSPHSVWQTHVRHLKKFSSWMYFSMVSW